MENPPEMKSIMSLVGKAIHEFACPCQRVPVKEPDPIGNHLGFFFDPFLSIGVYGIHLKWDISFTFPSCRGQWGTQHTLMEFIGG